MNAVVARFSFSGERMARYCFIMPSSYMRLIFAKTVVIGVLIFLAIWLAVNLLFSCMSVSIARSLSSSLTLICKYYTLLA